MNQLKLVLFREFIKYFEHQKDGEFPEGLKWIQTPAKPMFNTISKKYEKIRWDRETRNLKGELSFVILQKVSEKLSEEISNKTEKTLLDKIGRGLDSSGLHGSSVPRIIAIKDQIDTTLTLYLDMDLREKEIKRIGTIDQKITIGIEAPEVRIESAKRNKITYAIGLLKLKIKLFGEAIPKEAPEFVDIELMLPRVVSGTILTFDEEERGEWEHSEWEPVKYRFQHLPVHMALLHTGKVLAFGGSGNDPKHLSNPYPAEIFEPDEIGNDNGKVYEISNEGIQGDIFCAGHAFLPDGKLLVTGGTYKYDGGISGPIPPFSGLEHSYLFDPISLKWSRIQNLNYGRWYPTCIMIPDGRVVTMAGLTKHPPWVFLNKIEVYSNSGWRVLNGADRWLPLYPRLHLLPTGEIFYTGSYNTHYTFPFSVYAFPSSTLNVNTAKWTTIGNPKNVNREEGTSVLLPLLPPDYSARVMLIGGGTPTGNNAITNVEIIDFSQPFPHYQEVDSLKHARYYVYPVLLPDKTVLVIGGKTGKKGHLHDSSHMDHSHTHPHDIEHHPDAVLEPELFTPDDQRWKPMAEMKVDRLYHSNSLLLPDGRVMTAGSNPHRTINELRIEIFRPPYLFKGDRPIITKYPKNITYGKTFELESPQSQDIIDIALIRPTVTTHCVNTEQRYVGLEFSQKSPETLLVSVPANRNLIPPGYYLLFIISQEGVPSVAPFIQIN